MAESRLLITGGAGFVGANLVHHWLRHHPADRVVVLDALTYAGNLASLETARDNPSFRFVHGDIRNGELVEALLAEERIDTLVHLAAESHVDRSIAGPEVFVDVNIKGTFTLLEAARTVWLSGTPEIRHRHRFHHVSTDEVYGSLDPADAAFSETTPYSPNSPYAATKAASDHLVRAFHHTYGLQTTISNCSNNYGPFQFPEKLVPLCIVNLLDGQPLPIYGDGLNVRDWLHVEDHCRGIELILTHGRSGLTYNIGARNELRNIDLVRFLCRAVDRLFHDLPELVDRHPQAPPSRGEASESLIAFVDDRPGHDRRYAIDCSRIEKDLGFTPQIEFEAGLEQTVRWYLDSEAWWRAVMDDSYRRWIDRWYL